MHIGIVGPVDLSRLGRLVAGCDAHSNVLGSPMVTDLAVELRDLGNRVSVFTLSPDSADWGDCEGEGLALHVRPYRTRHRARDAFRAEIKALRGAIRADPPDLLHAQWTYEFALAVLGSGIPNVVTVHDWAPQILRFHTHPYRAVRLGMQAAVLLRAANLTANSPYIAERVRRWYHRQVPVIPNGIAMPDTLPQRPELVDGLVLGSVNNGMSKFKNVGALLAAFPLVRSQVPDAELRLVGSGFELDGPAHAWAGKRGLSQGVRFLGQQPAARIPGLMRSFDVLVHPSLEESFGLVLIEAIREGTLVVAGDRSGAVPWVLGGGEAGSLVDVRDPQAIAAAVLDLHDRRDDWPAMRERAFANVRTRFSMSRMVDDYVSLYEEVLSRSRRAAR